MTRKFRLGSLLLSLELKLELEVDKQSIELERDLYMQTAWNYN